MKRHLNPVSFAAVALCLAAGHAAAQDNTLRINSFGGAYETAHRKCVITPFEKETGAHVQVVTAYSADAFAQLRAQKNAPQFDVINFSGGQEIVAAAEGLLSPVDPKKLVNAADLYDFAKAGLAKGEGPAYSVAAIGMIYNQNSMRTPPASWKELMNPKLTPHLVLTDISNGYGMLGFLMLNKVEGGDLSNIQPGLNAVKKLLDGGATIVSTSPEIQQEFAQNAAWLAAYASDYAYTLTKANLPVKFTQAPRERRQATSRPTSSPSAPTRPWHSSSSTCRCRKMPSNALPPNCVTRPPMPRPSCLLTWLPAWPMAPAA